MSKLKRIICGCCGTVLGVLKLSHLAKRIFSPQIGNPENMQLLFHRQTLLIPSCNPNFSLWLPWAIVLYLTAIIIAILRKLSVFFMSINGKVEVSCYLRAEPPFSQQRVFGEGLLLSIVSSINRRRLNLSPPWCKMHGMQAQEAEPFPEKASSMTNILKAEKSAQHWVGVQKTFVGGEWERDKKRQCLKEENKSVMTATSCLLCVSSPVMGDRTWKVSKSYKRLLGRFPF